MPRQVVLIPTALVLALAFSGCGNAVNDDEGRWGRLRLRSDLAGERERAWALSRRGLQAQTPLARDPHREHGQPERYERGHPECAAVAR